jgi:hypothetical protein
MFVAHNDAGGSGDQPSLTGGDPTVIYRRACAVDVAPAQ